MARFSLAGSKQLPSFYRGCVSSLVTAAAILLALVAALGMLTDRPGLEFVVLKSGKPVFQLKRGGALKIVNVAGIAGTGGNAQEPHVGALAEPGDPAAAQQPDPAHQPSDPVGEQPAEPAVDSSGASGGSEQPARNEGEPERTDVLADDQLPSQPAETSATAQSAGEQPDGDGVGIEQPTEGLPAEQPAGGVLAEQPADKIAAEQPAETTSAEQPNDDIPAEQPLDQESQHPTEGDQPADGAAAAAEAAAAEAEAGATDSERPTGGASPSKIRRQPAGKPASLHPVWSAGGSNEGLAGHSAVNIVIPAGAETACEPLDLCSAGRVGHYWGDIATNSALREMLETIAYNKEVIMTLSHAQPLQMMNALNLYRSAVDLGMGHFFILVWEAAACEALPDEFKTQVSCVWDSRRPEYPEYANFDWLTRRWEVAARILRMGYNVLSIDSDSTLLDNPYTFLKSPQLGKFNVFTQTDTEGDASVNCGIVYLQNCHPSGPCMWMVQELVDRSYRQRENMEAMRQVYPGFATENTWEQSLWDDMVRSVITGRLGTYAALGENLKPEWMEIMGQAPFPMVAEEFEWPEEWWQRTGTRTGRVFRDEQQLVLPTTWNARWWKQYRRHFYPPQRKNSSIALMKLIRDANPEFPLWDPEHPWKPDAAPDIPPEHWATLPPWLGTAYAFRGQYGYWAMRPPAQVIAHAVYNAGPLGESVWKSYVAKQFGWWHWEVSEVYARHGEHLGMPVGQQGVKLLMLAPGVQLYTDTENEFRLAVLQLVRLAAALDRTLVVPNPPCDSPWMGVLETMLYRSDEERTAVEAGQLRLWPDYHDGFQAIQAPDLRQPNRTYCLWMRLLTASCVSAVATHIDALAYLERLQPPEDTSPTAENTLWHAEWTSAGGEDISSPDWATKPAVQLADAHAAVQAAAALEGSTGTVMYLGAVPQYGSDPEGISLPEASEGVQACWLFNPAFDQEGGLPYNQEAFELAQQRHGILPPPPTEPQQ